jgi:hypothetical protein
MGARGDLFIERHGAGLSDGIQTIQGDHRQDFHELPITVGVAGESLAQAGHGSR